mgnify:CR=1 FL=1
MKKQLIHQQGYKYRIKVYKNGKMVSNSLTSKFKRFISKCERVNFLNLKVYIKVTYPYKISGITAYNDGTYTNHKDLMQAVRAFTER